MIKYDTLFFMILLTLEV